MAHYQINLSPGEEVDTKIRQKACDTQRAGKICIRLAQTSPPSGQTVATGRSAD
jgi:hypothetical protein